MASFSRSSSSLLLVFVFFSFSLSSEAKEILIGGKSDSWAIPSAQEYSQSSLSQWAHATRFRIGDTLVWNYDGDKDSVLQVTKEAFESCNTTSPIEEHKDGATKVVLTRAGPYYFISGANGHCEKGQKVVVVVLSPRHHRSHALSPAPSPAELDAPAVAPTSGADSALMGGRLGFAVGLVGLFFFGLF